MVSAASRTITFMSDFGSDDEFVGVVHGVLATLAPMCRVIDLDHGVPRGDVRSGALVLLRAIQYMPPGVLLAVVDPGVGTSRRAIVVETGWGYMVGPDNGLLSPAVALVGGATRAFSIENPDVMLPARGRTFEGRDRFAPAAAVLATGEADLHEMGPTGRWRVRPGGWTLTATCRRTSRRRTWRRRGCRPARRSQCGWG